MNKIYHILFAGFLSITAAWGCEKRVYEPKELQNLISDKLVSCSMRYTTSQEKEKEFLLTCQTDTSTCNFPRADVSGIVVEVIATSLSRYKGPDAIKRLKEDLDQCGVKGLILSGGWENNYINGKINGVEAVEAVSPFTLKKLTEDELQRITNYFENQKVAYQR